MRTVIPKNAKLVPKDAIQVFKGVIFDVYQWPQEMFDGSKVTFEMLKRPDSVHTLAIKDDKIVVLEQEQPHQGSFFSLPGGRHDVETETEEEAAKREMLEETGMVFSKWKLLSVVQNHRNIDWFIYTFLADNFLEQKHQELDSGEKINVKLMTLEEVKNISKTPKARHLGDHILDKVNSLDELRAFPEYPL